MNVKRIKRKCGVRGCKNIVSFALSKTREFGNSVIMCRECMQEALKATESYTEPEKVKKEVKPLFPHPEKEVTLSSVAENKPEPVEVIEPTEESNTSVTEDTVTTETGEMPFTTPTPAKKTTTSRKKSK